MKKNKKIQFIVIAAIVILLGMTVSIVCANIIAKNVSTSNVQNDDFIDFEKPDEEQIANGNPNFYMITKGYGSGYWDTLIQGAVDAANEQSINLYVAGIAQESNTERLAYLMEEALSMNPDAIIVSPADTTRINEIVDKINEQNIPLIFVDTILNGQNFDACYMTDNMQAGRIAAEDMLSKLRAAGYKTDDRISIGIDIGSRQSQTIIERLAGVKEYWSNNAPDNWIIIDSIKINGGSADVAYEQCLEFFNENPDLAGLFALNNGSTVGLCRGVLEKERKDLVLVGFDYSDDIAALIENEEYCASTIVQRQYNMGYGSVNTALEICNGVSVKYRYVNTGITRVDNRNYNNPYIVNKILRK